MRSALAARTSETHLMSVAVVSVVLTATLAACSNDHDNTSDSTTAASATVTAGSSSPSAACVEAMALAADEPDIDRADALITTTLSVCVSVDEWLSALRLHPAALGVADPDDVGEVDVQAACGGDPLTASTPVCRDAAARGL